MSFEPRDYLRHILVETDYLIGQCGSLTFDQFVANETLRRASTRADDAGSCGICRKVIGERALALLGRLAAARAERPEAAVVAREVGRAPW